MRRRRPPRLIPGPRLPAIVQTAWWFLGRFNFARTCAHRYGPCFRVRLLGFGSVVVVADPTQMRQVLAEPDRTLAGGEANAYGGLLEQLCGESSILLGDGADHARRRAALTGALEGAEAVAETEAHAAASRSIAGWPRGRAFELAPAVERISLEVLATVLLGVAPGRRRQEVAVLAEWAGSWNNPQVLLPWLRSRRGLRSRWRRFASARAAVRQLVHSQLRSDETGECVATRLRDASTLSEEEIVDQLLSLLAVGHTPSANAMAWSLELLLRHSAVQRHLRLTLAEGREDYLEGVVQETLRLRPVGQWMARRVREPVAVCQGRVEPGELIVPNSFLAHHDPSVHAEPERFRPERFMDGAAAVEGWLPFGHGARHCPGADLAMAQMRGLLREVATTLELSSGRSSPEKIVPDGVSLVPAHGVVAVAVDFPHLAL
jgi:cytochrome P450 family 135